MRRTAALCTPIAKADRIMSGSMNPGFAKARAPAQRHPSASAISAANSSTRALVMEGGHATGRSPRITISAPAVAPRQKPASAIDERNAPGRSPRPNAIPSSIVLPVMFAVKTLPRPRKLIASTKPADQVSPSSSRSRRAVDESPGYPRSDCVDAESPSMVRLLDHLGIVSRAARSWQDTRREIVKLGA